MKYDAQNKGNELVLPYTVQSSISNTNYLSTCYKMATVKVETLLYLPFGLPRSLFLLWLDIYFSVSTILADSIDFRCEHSVREICS